MLTVTVYPDGRKRNTGRCWEARVAGTGGGLLRRFDTDWDEDPRAEVERWLAAGGLRVTWTAHWEATGAWSGEVELVRVAREEVA